LLGRAAGTLLGLNHLELARSVAAVALDRDAGAGIVHSTLAGILDAAGVPDTALPHWREAARLQPRHPQQRMNLALALLCRGDYDEGLALYEVRLDKQDWVPAATRASIVRERPRRLRQGDDVAGRHVVVFTEQGLGDSILFARYVPLLAAAGARISLVCTRALHPLFARLGGVAALLSPPPDQPVAKINLSVMEFDAWTPIGSLPLHFATRAESVPATIPYLRPDPARVAAWRARYHAAGRAGVRKIGVVFRANPDSASCAERSMAACDVAPFAELRQVDFVNLQYGPLGRALGAILPDMIDAMDSECPLDEFAAAVAATDLLITVDTMAAHCAGAMGHPTWIATPFVPHWYWSRPVRSPWYPDIAVFRQAVRRDWSGPIGEIAGRLGGGG
jgi:hypothetical protein